MKRKNTWEVKKKGAAAFKNDNSNKKNNKWE